MPFAFVARVDAALKSRSPRHGVRTTGRRAVLGGGVVLLALSCGSGSPTGSDRFAGRDGALVNMPGSDGGASELPAACANLAALPVTAVVLEGFSGSEDFAFDAEGNLVSTDAEGNLTRQGRNGDRQVVVPGLGETAGTRFLESGDLVIASVDDGALLRVGENGSVTTILSGLGYPNGVEVGQDGFVYVAEHDGGQVRRVDPISGEFTIVASDLTNPNGLAFDPQYETLYIGSFGGGTIHAVDIDLDGNPSDVRLFGKSPTAPPWPTGCAGKSDAATCADGYGEIGTCDANGQCELSLDAIPSELVESCGYSPTGAECDVSVLDIEVAGTCTRVNGQLACMAAQTCTDQDVACLDRDGLFGLVVGTCRAQGSDLECIPGEGLGGLDGLAVDLCGNVYVTEFTLGYVWRFPPSGGEPELAFDADSEWISNLHFGTDRGGWDSQTLYVMDREIGRIYAVPVGVGGTPKVYP